MQYKRAWPNDCLVLASCFDISGKLCGFRDLSHRWVAFAAWVRVANCHIGVVGNPIISHGGSPFFVSPFVLIEVILSIIQFFSLNSDISL